MRIMNRLRHVEVPNHGLRGVLHGVLWRAGRNFNVKRSRKTARCRGRVMGVFKWCNGGLLPVICPTCQNVFARSLMPATVSLLCMGLFSIFWLATGRLGRNGRLASSPEGSEGRGEDDPPRRLARNKTNALKRCFWLAAQRPLSDPLDVTDGVDRRRATQGSPDKDRRNVGAPWWAPSSPRLESVADIVIKLSARSDCPEDTR